MTETPRVVIIGAGGVATSLTSALKNKTEIVQIFSRSIKNARRLAEEIDNCQPIDNLSLLEKNADVYIISVKDDVITDVINQTDDSGALWLHTSGSTSINVFSGKRKRFGVLYPMQSFSKELIVDFKKVHLFIEGNNDLVLNEISKFATILSPHIHNCSSEDRIYLHIAAVFACNFANYMWTLSSEVLSKAGIEFKSILPLIKSTVDKLDTLSPKESQTGPAARHDERIVANHESMLNGEKKEIYSLLSRMIMASSDDHNN